VTREEAKQAAEVLLAYSQGKPIQFKHKSDSDWILLSENTYTRSGWSFYDFDYRIKQEPREFWIIFEQSGGVFPAYERKESAEACVGKVIHVKEVIE